MCLRLLLITSVIGLIIPYISAEVPNQCPDPSDPNAPSYFFYDHPDDCSLYFQCNHGTPIRRVCTDNRRWNNQAQTCVGANTFHDTCTRENALRECERGGLNPALIPHPTACQRYYDCSEPDDSKEKECNYPDLFDVNDKKCKDFKQAMCGPGRVPELDPCNYTIAIKPVCMCHRGSCGCMPCRVEWPSCVGFEDGLNIYTNREWSPYHVRCDTQRMVEKLYCGIHEASGFQGFFSPIKRQCVSLWEKPKSNGGYQQTCDGKAPGQYRVNSQEGPPHIYYSCPDEEVHFCAIGQYFKDDTQQCEDTGP